MTTYDAYARRCALWICPQPRDRPSVNLFKVNRPRPASPHFIIASASKRQTLKLSRSETDAPFTSSEFKAPSLSAAVSRDRLSPSSFHCNSVLRHCESTCQEKSRRFFFFFFFLFFFYWRKILAARIHARNVSAFFPVAMKILPAAKIPCVFESVKVSLPRLFLLHYV